MSGATLSNSGEALRAFGTKPRQRCRGGSWENLEVWSQSERLGNPEPSLSRRGRCNDLEGVGCSQKSGLKIKSSPTGNL